MWYRNGMGGEVVVAEDIQEEYKKNGFKVNKLGDYDLTLDFDKKPE